MEHSVREYIGRHESAGDFSAFEAATHSEPTNVPPLHTEYLLRQLSRGERALGFVFIPHVLVASAINVSGLVARDIAGT